MDISSLMSPCHQGHQFSSVIWSGLGARDAEMDCIQPCGLMREAMVQENWVSPLLALHRHLLELQLRSVGACWGSF